MMLFGVVMCMTVIRKVGEFWEVSTSRPCTSYVLRLEVTCKNAYVGVRSALLPGKAEQPFTKLIVGVQFRHRRFHVFLQRYSFGRCRVPIEPEMEDAAHFFNLARCVWNHLMKGSVQCSFHKFPEFASGDGSTHRRVYRLEVFQRPVFPLVLGQVFLQTLVIQVRPAVVGEGICDVRLPKTANGMCVGNKRHGKVLARKQRWNLTEKRPSREKLVAGTVYAAYIGGLFR